MDPNVSPSTQIVAETDDSLESLGLSGMSLMQLWGIGVESISELTKHTSESLRQKLIASDDGTRKAKKRVDELVGDVVATMTRRQQALRNPADVESLAERRELHQIIRWSKDEEPQTYAESTWFRNDPLGVLARDIRKIPILKTDVQMDLARQYTEEGNQTARDKLIVHNLRLVLSIARKYLWSQMELTDLVQEGVIGLMVAVDRFDYKQGNTLTTYATWWIRQGVSRFVQDHGKVIRIPVHLQESIMKMRRLMTELALVHGRPPALSEIAAAMGEEPKKIKKLLRVSRMQINSLDEVVSPGNDSEGDVSMHQLMADETSLRADHVLEARQELDAACNRVNDIVEAIYKDETISERNCEIFCGFYGLDGSMQKRTLEVTGERFDLTRERVRQIIAKTWRKLEAIGYDSDDDDLSVELQRIAALEKLAGKLVSSN